MPEHPTGWVSAQDTRLSPNELLFRRNRRGIDARDMLDEKQFAGAVAAVLAAQRTAPDAVHARPTRFHQLAVKMHRRALNVPHRTAWLCIHRYEGSWNDPNPPYYGGLQMDLHFQRTYAPALLRLKGTADHWTPLEQMWAAERARRSGRGFYPWPNTARYCGLI